ncbi:hypothetical protein [Flagellimonas sp. CMM7]|uniref:hypothetical protein n=1 Tax=Flagellimonas sp. CMM7 TaxID=2654676 RepID=UPI0013D4FE60|nr:hypothetical protein [Flagellimonas sp. CMM7]UII78725.1 hypothetical protein LV704_13760 [Flagellimonas sp. CMM7]
MIRYNSIIGIIIETICLSLLIGGCMHQNHIETKNKSKPKVKHLEDDFWGRYNSNMVTEDWMAFVDSTKRGMAVYTPITRNFLAGMAGNPGGKAESSSTSYVAPIKKVTLYKDSEYEYEHYLLVGELDEMRDRICKIKEKIN